MLLVVTPNPSLDRLVELSDLRPGQVHRARSSRVQAGGKGLNVARAARIWGADVELVAPLAGFTGRHVAALAESDETFVTSWVWLERGETRSCVLMLEEGRDATVVNEPGDAMGGDGWGRVAAEVIARAGTARAVAFCGSLLPGVVPRDLHALATSLAGSREVWIDTSGDALTTFLRDPAGIHLKVNHHELVTAWGSPIAPEPAARDLVARGARSAAITLGAGGVILVTPEGSWHLHGPAIPGAVSVGAGDAFLAGLLTARLEGHPWRAAGVRAIASGAAACSSGRPGFLDRRVAEHLESRVRE